MHKTKIRKKFMNAKERYLRKLIKEEVQKMLYEKSSDNIMKDYLKLAKDYFKDDFVKIELVDRFPKLKDSKQSILSITGLDNTTRKGDSAYNKLLVGIQLMTDEPIDPVNAYYILSYYDVTKGKMETKEFVGGFDIDEIFEFVDRLIAKQEKVDKLGTGRIY